MSENQAGDDGVDVSDYQNQLSDDVSDGGGCTETWEDLTEMRSDDGSMRDRRSVIKSVAAAAIGFGFASGTASADVTSQHSGSGDDVTFDVLEVSHPRERAQVKRQAFTSREVKEIRREFVSNGWRPRMSDTMINKTVHENGDVHQYTLTIPFKTDRGDASIIWTDNSNLEVKGIRGLAGDDGEMTFERYTVTNGQVISSTNTVTEAEIQEAMPDDNSLSNSSQVSVQTHTGSFPDCEWNTSCVGTFAATAGGMVACCATCSSGVGTVGTGGAACVCCVLTAIGFVSIECNVCE